MLLLVDLNLKLRSSLSVCASDNFTEAPNPSLTGLLRRPTNKSPAGPEAFSHSSEISCLPQ